MHVAAVIYSSELRCQGYKWGRKELFRESTKLLQHFSTLQRLYMHNLRWSPHWLETSQEKKFKKSYLIITPPGVLAFFLSSSNILGWEEIPWDIWRCCHSHIVSSEDNSVHLSLSPFSGVVKPIMTGMNMPLVLIRRTAHTSSPSSSTVEYVHLRRGELDSCSQRADYGLTSVPPTP